MRRLAFAVLLGGLTLLPLAVTAQPPGPGGKGGKGGGKGPPKFELGRIFPPQLQEQLELTDEQKKQLAALEKDLKEKLTKLLTDEQKKTLENFRPGPPGGGPGGPPGGGPGGPPDGGKGGKGGPPPERPEPQAHRTSGEIPWFTSIDAAKAEAVRTGRPILLVSAAPHCGGVSGMW